MTEKTSPEQTLFEFFNEMEIGFSNGFRSAQVHLLDAFGFGPRETEYQVVASGAQSRLRHYPGNRKAPPVLLVPAPIKRPYIWDLSPSLSAVRYCLLQGFDVFLVEWLPPPDGDGSAGIADYVYHTLSDCVRSVCDITQNRRPAVIGHSLGGTLAAILAAMAPESLCALVLLGAPLCFEPGSSRFRDNLVSLMPANWHTSRCIAGSVLSGASAAIAPDMFTWSRWLDCALSLSDPSSLDVHMRVERWMMDEVPLPGVLVSQIMNWLYRENRFAKGDLRVGGNILGPHDVRAPTLAIINTADEIAPKASVASFVAQLPGRDGRIIEFSPEVGTGLPHLAILTGRQAYASVWPEVTDWIKLHI